MPTIAPGQPAALPDELLITWKVKATHLQTGASKELVVSAATEEDAMSYINELGYVASEFRPELTLAVELRHLRAEMILLRQSNAATEGILRNILSSVQPSMLRPTIYWGVWGGLSYLIVIFAIIAALWHIGNSLVAAQDLQARLKNTPPGVLGP